MIPRYTCLRYVFSALDFRLERKRVARLLGVADEHVPVYIWRVKRRVAEARHIRVLPVDLCLEARRPGPGAYLRVETARGTLALHVGSDCDNRVAPLPVRPCFDPDTVCGDVFNPLGATPCWPRTPSKPPLDREALLIMMILDEEPLVGLTELYERVKRAASKAGMRVKKKHVMSKYAEYSGKGLIGRVYIARLEGEDGGIPVLVRVESDCAWLLYQLCSNLLLTHEVYKAENEALCLARLNQQLLRMLHEALRAHRCRAEYQLVLDYEYTPTAAYKTLISVDYLPAIRSSSR